MRIIVYIFFFLSFFSCEKKDKILQSKKKNTNPSNCVDVKLWSKEVLNIDSVLLNGSIKIITNKDTILEYFGNPLKILKNKRSGFLPNILRENRNSESYTMVYENIIFEGVGNTVILNKVFLDKDYLESSNIIFKKDLNIRDVCADYPESCKLTLPGGNGWSGHIELIAFKQGYLRWFLAFKGEQLVSMELHRSL